MKFRELTEEEYNEFALKNRYISIYQIPGWGKLKKSTGWDYYFVGLEKDFSIVGATLLLRNRVLPGMYLFYAPRGFLIDSDNLGILKEFNDGVIKFIKSHHGFMLKIDPNVIYNLRDTFGNVKKTIGDKDLHNYISLGYKHTGFTLNFETMQPRYLCRYKILDTYEDTIKQFTKSTQKNTLKSYEMGVRCREIDDNEIDLFVSMLSKTAEEKHFIIRPVWYYERMKKIMPDAISYYVTYLDTDIYHAYVSNKIKEEENNVISLKAKMAKYQNVGEKLKHELQIAEEQVAKFKKEQIIADELQKQGTRINIGCLMSVFVGKEGTTFMSGTDSLYKKFNIKYAFYDYHLRESIKRNKKYVNFYGISGDMNETGPYYNIYALKKGYNPEIMELIGEFDYVISKPKYYFYKIAFKIYKTLKKLK